MKENETNQLLIHTLLKDWKSYDLSRLKKIFFLSLFLNVTFFAFSQTQWKIELSHEIPVPRMGNWVKGDYNISVVSR